MYFLNDKHIKYQYALYTKINNGVPFITELKSVTNDYELYIYLLDKSKRHERYNQLYYIDFLDFKKNKVDFSNYTYYKPLKRVVNDWEEIS